MTPMTRMSQMMGITEFQKQTVRGFLCVFCCYLMECCSVLTKRAQCCILYFFIRKDIQKDWDKQFENEFFGKDEDIPSPNFPLLCCR